MAMDGEYEVHRISAERAETHVDMLAQLAQGRGLFQPLLDDPSSVPTNSRLSARATISEPLRTGQWPEWTSVGASDSRSLIVSRQASTSSWAVAHMSRPQQGTFASGQHPS